MPPPGPYVPPNQNQSTPPHGYGAQHQQPGYQQPQAPTAHQSSSQGHGQPSQSYKSSGGTFGQMMNQAVTTGKPMLNKLSKTISSKLGNKQSTSGTPQYSQNYQNYQQQYSQQAQVPSQQQSHTFNPQPQQAQQPLQTTHTYTAQQSPYQQPTYVSGKVDYLSQQASSSPQTPYTQTASPSQQNSYTGYNGGQAGHNHGGNTIGEQHAYAQQGQYNQGQISQSVAPGQHQQQPLQAQYSGQQMGVVGATPPPHPAQNPQSSQIPNASPVSPAPQHPQLHNPSASSEQPFVPAYQQQSQVSPNLAQSYFPSPNAQALPNQQWTPLSPTGSEGQSQSFVPPATISPTPPLPIQSKPPATSAVSPQHSQTSTPAPQANTAYSGPPTEFIAELPADMGNLSISQAKPMEQVPMSPSEQTSPYQAYQSTSAQAGQPSPGFTIARRAVSMSNVPYADPWRFADPLTELPTREFYVLADLLYDALDRKFEPQNTGLLEASKILKSWIDLTEDAIRKLPLTKRTGDPRLPQLRALLI